MTEIEILRRAKRYVDSLANGFDPLTGEPVREGDVVNQVRVSRCLFYVSDILRQVIENGGAVTRTVVSAGPRRPFTITAEELRGFPYSDRPLPISVIAKEISALTDQEQMRALQPRQITDYLVEAGMMRLEDVGNGKKAKVPTPEGEALGIIAEDRMSPAGYPYISVIYSRSAQQFIIDNMPAVLARMDSMRARPSGTRPSGAARPSWPEPWRGEEPEPWRGEEPEHGGGYGEADTEEPVPWT